MAKIKLVKLVEAGAVGGLDIALEKLDEKMGLYCKPVNVQAIGRAGLFALGLVGNALVKETSKWSEPFETLYIAEEPLLIRSLFKLAKPPCIPPSFGYASIEFVARKKYIFYSNMKLDVYLSKKDEPWTLVGTLIFRDTFYYTQSLDISSYLKTLEELNTLKMKIVGSWDGSSPQNGWVTFCQVYVKPIGAEVGSYYKVKEFVKVVLPPEWMPSGPSPWLHLNDGDASVIGLGGYVPPWTGTIEYFTFEKLS